MFMTFVYVRGYSQLRLTLKRSDHYTKPKASLFQSTCRLNIIASENVPLVAIPSTQSISPLDTIPTPSVNIPSRSPPGKILFGHNPLQLKISRLDMIPSSQYPLWTRSPPVSAPLCTQFPPVDILSGQSSPVKIPTSQCPLWTQYSPGKILFGQIPSSQYPLWT